MVGATDNRSSTDSRGGSERSTRNTLVRNASSASLTRAGGSRAEPTQLRFATRNPNQSGIRIDPDRGRVTVTTITLLGFEVADRDEATRGPVRRQQPEVSSHLRSSLVSLVPVTPLASLRGETFDSKLSGCARKFNIFQPFRRTFELGKYKHQSKLSSRDKVQ